MPHPTLASPRGGWRDESGATTAEHVAVLTVVGAVVAAILAIPIAPVVAAWGSYAVCTLFGGDGCDRPGLDGRTDSDFQPEHCDLVATSYDGSIGVDVLVFDVETGVTYARTERSDGSTAFTVVASDGAGVGVESPGVEAQAGPLDVDVGAEAGVGVAVEEGQTWVVPTGEADDLQALLLRDLAHDQTLGRTPIIGSVTGWVKDQAFGVAPDPDITFLAGGVNAYADANARLSYFDATVAGAEAGIEGAVMLGVEQDRSGAPSEWRDTEYLEVSGGVSGSLGLATVGVGGEVGATSVLKVERDLDGRLTGVEVVDSVTGTALGDLGSRLTDTSSVLRAAEDSSVIETVRLDVGTPEERETVEGWLRGATSTTAFDDLVREEAVVTLEQRAGEEFGLDLGAKVAFGVKLGASGSGSRTVSQLEDAYFLGAPDATGVRSPVRFDECLHAAG